ncbi:glycosyltransferase family 4 protein [Actinoplanes sp. NPDC049548]|uniref:glycosyltransferase family 4 protein n=1 Tax=Actinoplanes sp. NPDC049548 TaxID=3155152 RepID=UPI003416ABC0
MARVGLINHGADAAVPGPPPSRSRTVVFGGFLSPAKGLEDLLDAWQKISATSDYQTDHQLLIAGTCARQHEDWLAALRADSAGLAKPPRWLGYLDDREFTEVIAAAGVVVLPYRSSNPSSGILVRAMVQGRPVVATRVTAMELLIADGVTGELVDVGDVAALAGKLDGLIRDPARRDALGAAAARVAAERHTWARQVADLKKVYALSGGPA